MPSKISRVARHLSQRVLCNSQWPARHNRYSRATHSSCMLQNVHLLLHFSLEILLAHEYRGPRQNVQRYHRFISSLRARYSSDGLQKYMCRWSGLCHTFLHSSALMTYERDRTEPPWYHLLGEILTSRMHWELHVVRVGIQCCHLNVSAGDTIYPFRYANFGALDEIAWASMDTPINRLQSNYTADQTTGNRMTNHMPRSPFVRITAMRVLLVPCLTLDTTWLLHTRLQVSLSICTVVGRTDQPLVSACRLQLMSAGSKASYAFTAITTLVLKLLHLVTSTAEGLLSNSGRVVNDYHAPAVHVKSNVCAVSLQSVAASHMSLWHRSRALVVQSFRALGMCSVTRSSCEANSMGGNSCMHRYTHVAAFMQTWQDELKTVVSFCPGYFDVPSDAIFLQVDGQDNAAQDR